MRLFRYVLLGIVGVCSVVLSGCSFIWTTENGDPATPEDIKSSVEKEFSVVHPNLVLQSSVVEKEKPFQRNVYVFYDESNGISFTTNSVVKWPTLPAPGGERKNDADFAYSQAYLVHLNGSLVERAKQYGMRMATHEEVLELAKSKATLWQLKTTMLHWKTGCKVRLTLSKAPTPAMMNTVMTLTLSGITHMSLRLI